MTQALCAHMNKKKKKEKKKEKSISSLFYMKYPE
jgi:hypothetical protein